MVAGDDDVGTIVGDIVVVSRCVRGPLSRLVVGGEADGPELVGDLVDTMDGTEDTGDPVGASVGVELVGALVEAAEGPELVGGVVGTAVGVEDTRDPVGAVLLGA